MASSSVAREDLKLTGVDQGKLAFILHGVYTKEECEQYIAETEKRGFETALLNVGAGRQVLRTDVRNSDRCIWDSVEEADKMWQRIKEHVPETFRGRKVVGLNERLRFLRYDPGQYFKPHKDGSFTRDNGETSFITAHLYLNEGFKGGSTTFLKCTDYASLQFEEVAAAVPKTGSVLVFQHNILHEGSEVVEGRKYTVRTDVMYSASA